MHVSGAAVLALVSLALLIWAIAFIVAGLRWQGTLSDMAEVEPPAAVEIVRDAWGVPTVFGETDAAVAYGLAYAHAEDDFPVIQERLAVVRGQLGRLKGAEGAKVDYFRALIDSRGQTEAGYDRLSPEGLAVARGYAAGLNAYAAAHADKVVVRGAFPVTERDIVEGFVLISPLFFGLDMVVGDLVEGRGLEMAGTFGPPDDRGSNAFAIAPSRMADGSTVLISNSHQPWYGVAAWYEARLVSGNGGGEPWSMQGVTFPGAPMILMGHNETLGWTNTVNRPDMVDIYKLQMGGDGNNYRYDGVWRELERERVWLRVKMGPFVMPVPQWVERSVHGPVVRNDEGVFAFRYGSMGETRHLDQYHRLQKTTTFAAWREVMAMQAIPGTNFIYADAEGNIGMLYNASLPERDAEVDWSGVLPGDRSALVWESYEPAEDIPFLINPPSGFIFNANNTPLLATDPADDFTAEDFPDLVGIEDRMTNRALRAQALLRADESLTRDELHAIKMDAGVERDSKQGRTLADVFAIMEGEAAEVIAGWDWDFDGDHPADALALMSLHEVWPSIYFDVEAPELAEVAMRAPAHLMEHFGRIDPPMGELLRLRRGEVDVPLTGGPGVLRAIHSEVEDDGRLSAWNGDGFVLEVHWPAGGGAPVTRTVMAHGSAVADADSPHNADQAALFARGDYKDSPLPSWEDRPASLR